MRERCNPRQVYKTLVKPSDGPVSKYFNRKISLRITCFLINHGINTSPNKITNIITLLGLLTAIIIPYNPIIGGVLVELVSILDGVDGEYARITGKTTRYGAFLDSVSDRIVDLALLTASHILLFKIIPGLYGFIIASWVTGFSIIVSYLHCRAEASLKLDIRRLGWRVYAGRDVRLFLLSIALIILQIQSLGYMILLLIIGSISTIYVIDRMIKTYTYLTGAGKN